MSGSREAMLQERWLRQVGRWLDTITGDDWEGTPRDAADALADVATYGDALWLNPTPKLQHAAEFIRRAGWILEVGRTRKARYIRLTRDKTPA
jgi:hypothetical protein